MFFRHAKRFAQGFGVERFVQICFDVRRNGVFKYVMFDGNQVFIHCVLEYGKGQLFYCLVLLLGKSRCLKVQVAHFLFVKSVLGAVLSNRGKRLFFRTGIAHRTDDYVSVDYFSPLQLDYHFFHSEMASIVHIVVVRLLYFLHGSAVGVFATIGVVALDHLAKLIARFGTSIGAFKVFVIQLYGSFCKVPQMRQ